MALYWSFLLPSSVCLAFTCFNQCFLKLGNNKIYRNQQALAFCREHGIRLSGPALGRPTQDPNLSTLLRKQEYQDLCDRSVVEVLFGTAKTAYGLGRIPARLEGSSRCVIAVALLLWNLTKRLRSLWRAFLRFLFSLPICGVTE